MSDSDRTGARVVHPRHGVGTVVKSAGRFEFITYDSGHKHQTTERWPVHIPLDLTAPRPRADGWTSVEDALPDAEPGTLFLSTWRGEVHVVRWQPGTPHLWTSPIAWGARMHEVTHWRPMPAPAVTAPWSPPDLSDA